MLIYRYADDVVAWAPAKVNLHLEVLGKRPDGYHEIATLMVAIRLFDTLVFRDASGGDIRLACTQAGLSLGPDNLIVRAARLLQDHTGCTRGATIRLVKRIPMAAGLAGGSTDAAATLVGLNKLWRLGLGSTDLARLAARLGSDIPFFLGGPAAWCTGRGEIVEPLPLGAVLHLVLLCPRFGCATAEGYRRVVVPEKPQSGEAIRKAVAAGDVAGIAASLHNRLQPAAERLAPRLAEYATRLRRLGPAGVLMSGSGSTLFALCRDRDEAKRIARLLKHGLEREAADDEIADEEDARVFLVRSPLATEQKENSCGDHRGSH
ncbi:MAG: 4-(cytidine 5'-diphospho)-2-C-methyl-D-erythritol kinase [Planctomycetes bacterium]|nr:4-(cytidine 5'-diphospho)-2-C-methyl-D-erythritol kinase [Planctomycetota bacterium]